MFTCTLFLLGAASQVSPIEKTIELLQGLQAKDGEASKKIYEEFLEYCEDHSKELQYSIKTGKAEIERQTRTSRRRSTCSAGRWGSSARRCVRRASCRRG